MEEKELTQNDLEIKADIENKGRSADVKQSVSEELGLSPLEEIKNLNADTKRNLEKMQAERERMEKIMGELLVTGHGFAGQQPKEKTQEEKDEEAAKKIMAVLNK